MTKITDQDILVNPPQSYRMVDTYDDPGPTWKVELTYANGSSTTAFGPKWDDSYASIRSALSASGVKETT